MFPTKTLTQIHKGIQYLKLPEKGYGLKSGKTICLTKYIELCLTWPNEFNN